MAVRINTFGTWDYVVFVGMLMVSIAIGVYFAVKDRKQNNQGEYLMAGRSMSILPIAISIFVSFVSAILILGTPAEMYTQGTMYYLSSLGMFVGILMAAVLYVPLLYPLKITSAFEYLELRYNSKAVRLTGTILMILSQVIYMGIASYAPSTALKAVTGFPVWATILIIGVVATIYTTIGGMKAVVWTDVFQSVVMVAGILAIVIQGTIKVGSMEEVWRINDEWDRIKFSEFSPDPTVRHTFWGLTIGASVGWLGTYGINQPSVQRYCSLPTLQKAQISVLVNIFACVFFLTITCLSGIVVFAYYVKQNCDPLGQKLVDNPNQIIPFFVMETLNYPAIPGLFISSLFSGALSTVSSSLNALAAITWEDILKPHLNEKMPEARKMFLTKLLVLGFGVLAVGMSFLTQTLEGTLLQAAISLIGSASAPIAGLFILGPFFPWATAKGAMAGAVCSLAISLWLSIGSYVAGIPLDEFPFPNGTCSAYLPNVTMETTLTTTPITTMTSQVLQMTTEASSNEKSGLDRMYTVSYLWFNFIGVLACVIIGLIVSFITGANSMDDVPVKYQIPFFTRVFCCLPSSWKYALQCHRGFPNTEELQATLDDEDFDVSLPEFDFDKKIDNQGFDLKEESVKETGVQDNGLSQSSNSATAPKERNNSLLVQRL